MLNLTLTYRQITLLEEALIDYRDWASEGELYEEIRGLLRAINKQVDQQLDDQKQS